MILENQLAIDLIVKYFKHKVTQFNPEIPVDIVGSNILHRYNNEWYYNGGVSSIVIIGDATIEKVSNLPNEQVIKEDPDKFATPTLQYNHGFGVEFFVNRNDAGKVTGGFSQVFSDNELTRRIRLEEDEGDDAGKGVYIKINPIKVSYMSMEKEFEVAAVSVLFEFMVTYHIWYLEDYDVYPLQSIEGDYKGDTTDDDRQILID